MDISQLASAASSSSRQDVSRGIFNDTLQDFLAIMTAQLENQLPTEPVDATSFVDQVSTLASVEQQIGSNDYLEQLVALSRSSDIDKAVNYIGRLVQARGNESQLVSDGQQSGAVFVYDLPTAARTATITIQDATGRVVFTGEALGNQGKNELLWDGSNNLTGGIMQPGKYSFTINAKDYNNNPVRATTYTTGIIDSANIESGKVKLSTGDIEIDADQVVVIKSAQSF